MCNLPECDTATVDKNVVTHVPGTTPVTLRFCPACDTRRCNDCKANVPDPFSKACPAGHRL